MPPAVPGRRVDATVPGPRRVAIMHTGTYGGAPMSPLRCPDKAKAPRSLIAVSIRLVQRYARARRRSRATVQKPFQRRGEVFYTACTTHYRGGAPRRRGATRKASSTAHPRQPRAWADGDFDADHGFAFDGGARRGPPGALEPGARPHRGGGGGCARALAVYKPPPPKKKKGGSSFTRYSR
jgi:hypothetical protein